MSQIVATAIEAAKLYHENNEKPIPCYQAVSSILNQRNVFLLEQAVYLTEQVPKLVTAVEYNTLAGANANAGDVFTAEKYYLKGIARSDGAFYKSIALRGYAAFLFPQRRFEEGRALFKQAISLLQGGSNQVRFTNGYTYQMWAWNELHNAESIERARQLFESAASEYTGIDNDKVSSDALAGLYAAIPLPSSTSQPVKRSGLRLFKSNRRLCVYPRLIITGSLLYPSYNENARSHRWHRPRVNN